MEIRLTMHNLHTAHPPVPFVELAVRLCVNLRALFAETPHVHVPPSILLSLQQSLKIYAIMNYETVCDILVPDCNVARLI